MAQDVGEISAGKQVPEVPGEQAGYVAERIPHSPVDVRADRPRQQKADPCHDPFAAAFFEQDQRNGQQKRINDGVRPDQGCKTGQQRRIEQLSVLDGSPERTQHLIERADCQQRNGYGAERRAAETATGSDEQVDDDRHVAPVGQDHVAGDDPQQQDAVQEKQYGSQRFRRNRICRGEPVQQRSQRHIGTARCR